MQTSVVSPVNIQRVRGLDTAITVCTQTLLKHLLLNASLTSFVTQNISDQGDDSEHSFVRNYSVAVHVASRYKGGNFIL